MASSEHATRTNSIVVMGLRKPSRLRWAGGPAATYMFAAGPRVSHTSIERLGLQREFLDLLHPGRHRPVRGLAEGAAAQILAMATEMLSPTVRRARRRAPAVRACDGDPSAGNFDGRGSRDTRTAPATHKQRRPARRTRRDRRGFAASLDESPNWRERPASAAAPSTRTSAASSA